MGMQNLCQNLAEVNPIAVQSAGRSSTCTQGVQHSAEPCQQMACKCLVSQGRLQTLALDPLATFITAQEFYIKLSFTSHMKLSSPLPLQLVPPYY